MGDSIIGRYVNTYLAPLKYAKAKLDTIKSDPLQKAFFEKIDKDKNQELDQNEASVISNAKELNPEKPEEKQRMEIAARVSQISPENTATVLALNNNNVEETIVISKGAETGNFSIRTLIQGDEQHPLILAESRDIKDNVETITSFNPDGSKSVTKGAETISYDAQGRITAKFTNKGSGGVQKVEYQYQGDSNVPTKQINTTGDGVKSEITENIQNPNQPAAQQPPATSPQQPVENPQAAQENAAVVTDEAAAVTPTSDNNAASQAASNQPAHSGPIYPKEGETFLATARRIFGDDSLTKDDPRYKALASAYPKEAKRNWFKLGTEIKVPDSVKDKIADGAYGVDKAAEEKQYVDKSVEKANTDKYNDDNTEIKTLNKSTSWWMLAKENLQATGVQNPSYAQIYERIGELVKLNEGKEPTKGTEIKMPKAGTTSSSEDASGTNQSPAVAGRPAQSSEAPQATPDVTTPPPAKDNTQLTKTVTPPAQDTNPPEKYTSGELQLLNNKSEEHKNNTVTDENGNKITYDENGYIHNIVDSKGNMCLFVERDANGNIKQIIRSEYNADGKPIKQINVDKDGNIKSYIDFVYNADKNDEQYIERDSSGKVISTVNFEYNEQKKVSLEIKRNANGEVTEYTKYEYDGNNVVLREIYYDPDGNLVKYYVCETMTYYKPDGTVMTEEES